MSVRCGPSLAVLLPDAAGFLAGLTTSGLMLRVFLASSRGAHALAGLQLLSAPLPGDHKRRVAALREQGRVQPAAQLTAVKCAQHSPEKAKSILTYIYQVTTHSGVCALYAGLTSSHEVGLSKSIAAQVQHICLAQFSCKGWSMSALGISCGCVTLAGPPSPVVSSIPAAATCTTVKAAPSISLVSLPLHFGGCGKALREARMTPNTASIVLNGTQLSQLGAGQWHCACTLQLLIVRHLQQHAVVPKEEYKAEGVGPERRLWLSKMGTAFLVPRLLHGAAVAAHLT